MTIETTEQKILISALELFLNQGIKKTNLDEVAFRAGVTRITVYRYFSDKKWLVRAALMHIPAVLDETRSKLASDPAQNVEAVLDMIGAQFAAIPAGDLPALLDELQRVYPDVWTEVHKARLKGIKGVFDQLFTLAESQGLLRPGLNRAVVQAYFMSAVVNVLENPSMISLGLSTAKIFQTVKAIFLHGILNEKDKRR